MEAPIINAPKKIPLFFKLALWISKKETGKDLLTARMMTWYPRSAIGSGVLELMTAKGKTPLEKRLLNLVRLQASLVCSCRFCVDMNSASIEKNGISEEEFSALRDNTDCHTIATLSVRESLAIEYATRMSNTPLVFEDGFIDKLKANFSEKEIVMLASTIASVNYWARFNQALGIPSAGFNDKCMINKT